MIFAIYTDIITLAMLIIHGIYVVKLLIKNFTIEKSICSIVAKFTSSPYRIEIGHRILGRDGLGLVA